jgi:hypothetical protein
MEEKGPYTRTQRFPTFLPRFDWDNFILFPANAPCPTQGHSRSGYFADEEKGGGFFWELRIAMLTVCCYRTSTSVYFICPNVSPVILEASRTLGVQTMHEGARATTRGCLLTLISQTIGGPMSTRNRVIPKTQCSTLTASMDARVAPQARARTEDTQALTIVSRL